MPVPFRDSKSDVKADAKLERFTSAIEALTTERESMMLLQAEERKLKLLQQAEERFKHEIDYLFRERLSDISSAIAAERSDKVNQLRGQLFREREAYAERVFAMAEKEIASFVAGGAYEAFILDLAQQLSLKYDCRAAEISLREPDQHLVEKLAQVFPAGCVFLSSADIRLGGLTLWLPEQKILIDERLETRLAEQRLWFYEHSELSAAW